VKFARGCKSDEKDVRDDMCEEFSTEVCYSVGKTKVRKRVICVMVRTNISVYRFLCAFWSSLLFRSVRRSCSGHGSGSGSTSSNILVYFCNEAVGNCITPYYGTLQ